MVDRKTEGVHGFIITKPLQLLVVMAILEQLPREPRKELLIVDSFADAAAVCRTLARYESIWGNALFFKDQRALSDHCQTVGYTKLFMDSDVGFRKNFELMSLKARHRSTRFAVYEEGLGTYRADLYSGVRKLILRIVGAGVFFGGNRLTSEIYVYDNCEYDARFGAGKTIKIETGIPALFKKYAPQLLHVFGADELREYFEQFSHKKKLAIYLASWDIDRDALAAIRCETGARVIKAHPHQKTALLESQYPGFSIAPAGVPAEILLLVIGTLFEEIVLYHHGTSVLRYIKNDSFRYVLLNQVRRTSFS